MADIITNLHPDGDENTNLYPNIKKENIPSKSISTDKLDDNVLSLIGSLKPAGTDTSTNILAFTSNKGIYVATDDGHWYYWNGSAYVDGGVYQSSEDIKQLSESIIKSTNNQNINNISNDKILLLSKIKYGGYLTIDNEWVDDTRTYTTDFIRCDKISHINCLLGTPNANYNLLFYDINKTFIEGVALNVSTPDTIATKVIPKNVYYFKMCFYNTDMGIIYPSYIDDNIDYGEVINGYYISSSDGSRVSHSEASITDYLDISNYEFINYCSFKTGTTTYAFYDKNKIFISGGSLAGTNINHKIEVPQIAKYIIMSMYTDVIDSFYLKANIRKTKKSVYDGKTISILGDSISTYAGFIPSNNRVFYPSNGITNVSQTWWYKLIEALGMNILINNSSSGSNASGTDSLSGFSRCENLGTETENPDVIIIYLGTNDFDHNIPLGTYDCKSEIPTDVSTFRSAYANIIAKISSKYKKAEIWCCTIQPMERHGAKTYPEINSLGLTIEDYNIAIREIANSMNVKILEHSKCGITYFNMSEYFGDYSSSCQHPNAKGHSLIANNDIRQMDSGVRFRYSIN